MTWKSCARSSRAWRAAAMVMIIRKQMVAQLREWTRPTARLRSEKNARRRRGGGALRRRTRTLTAACPSPTFCRPAWKTSSWQPGRAASLQVVPARQDGAMARTTRNGGAAAGAHRRTPWTPWRRRGCRLPGGRASAARVEGEGIQIFRCELSSEFQISPRILGRAFVCLQDGM